MQCTYEDITDMLKWSSASVWRRSSISSTNLTNITSLASRGQSWPLYWLIQNRNNINNFTISFKSSINNRNDSINICFSRPTESSQNSYDARWGPGTKKVMMRYNYGNYRQLRSACWLLYRPHGCLEMTQNVSEILNGKNYNHDQLSTCYSLKMYLQFRQSTIWNCTGPHTVT